MARPRIGELLVSARVLAQDKLDEALRQPRAPGQRLGSLLVQLGLVSETQLTQILGQQLSVPWVSLYHIDFSRQLLNLVPREVAEKYCLVPIYVRRVRKQGETLYVAMDDPTNDVALAEVAQHAGLPAQPMIACPTDIRSALRVYYGAQDPAAPPPPAPLSERLGPIAGAGTRSSIPPAKLEEVVAGDHPDAEPEIEAVEVELPRRAQRPMVAVTMLDGTTLRMPARGTSDGEAGDGEAGDAPHATLTARDIVRALRDVSHGKAQNEIGIEIPHWEELFAALLSVLMRKGLVADWEFIEELRKVRRRPGEAAKPKA